jgi:hypothetical protein
MGRGTTAALVLLMLAHIVDQPFCCADHAPSLLQSSLQGLAKTGSGKTAAFVLPMLVHIMDQPELEKAEGPIGLILAPTRELSEQIHKETRKFSKPYGKRLAVLLEAEQHLVMWEDALSSFVSPADVGVGHSRGCFSYSVLPVPC